MEFYDLGVHRGETFLRTLRFKRGGEYADLEGYTAKCQVRTAPDGGELIAEMTAVISAEPGRVDLLIPAEVTRTLSSGKYVWDLRMTSDEDVTRYYLGGRFTVWSSVTE